MKNVIIVGAGVIGLMCAVRLAKAGARVTVLEEHNENTTVWGPTASASAAGMLAPLNESPHDALGFTSFDLWRAWRDGSPWADAVRFDGGVVFARDERDAANVISRAHALKRDGEHLSVGKFRKRTGLRAEVEHAVLIPDEGVADPLRALSGLVMDARAHGVLVSFGEDAIEASANTITTHAGHTFEADQIVFAPGVWATDALIALAPALKHVRPAKGCLVPVQFERPVAPNIRADGFYIAQRYGDAVLGATLDFDRTDRRVELAQVEVLLTAADAALPGELRPAGKPWTGIRPMSPDGWPMIGRSGDVLIAAGHSRNGWLLAPITAEIITAYVMGAAIPAEWAALSPDRFETP
jgi:glycine oxidase